MTKGKAGKSARRGSPRTGKATSRARPPARNPSPSTAVSGSASRAQPAADLPGYCLGHLRSEDSYSPFARRYDLYPVGIPRPVHGQTTATIVCGTCGKGLLCTVSSCAQMRRRRLAAWLALAATEAGCCTGFVCSILLSDSLRSPYFLPEFVVPLIVMTVVLAVCGVNLGAVPPTGVRLWKYPLHEIRQPGDAVSVEYPRGAEGA